jgi:hypothetical protein
MAVDPLPYETVASLPTAPGRAKAVHWSRLSVAKVLFLFALGMVQAWLYGWSLTEQQKVDDARIETEQVRARVRDKAYRYAKAVEEFQMRPEEQQLYQRLAPDRVDRIILPANLPDPVVRREPPARDASRWVGLAASLREQWRSFLAYLNSGRSGARGGRPDGRQRRQRRLNRGY